MAQPIPCDVCGQNAADFVITAVANGDTMGLGAECVAAWAELIVQALDAAAAAPVDEIDPPAAGYPDPADEPDEEPTDAPTDPADPAEPAEGRWEYPEPDPAPRGRQGGRRRSTADVRGDSQAATAAADRG